MSHHNANYCLLLDANVWVSERMLHSSVGSAVLFAVAANSATIVLPEIVELEVDRVLKNEAGKASAALRKSVDLLRQLSGHERILQPVPTEKAIHEGMARRWKELDGVIVRAPFTFEQARASLQRILNHAPPCGENNEQFRDCCIWETVLEFSASRIVHFVTNDSAFYENRDRLNIVKPLKNELETLGRDVRLHRTIQTFLAAVSQNEITILEKDTICDAVVEIVTPKAQEIASERAVSRVPAHIGAIKRFELSDAQNVIIKGYATPKKSIVAVTFEVLFDLLLFRSDEGEEQQIDTTLRLEGSCSYNPTLRETSDLLVSTWHHTLKGTGFNWSTHSAIGAEYERQLMETRYI
ncbi:MULTISPECIES: PIN domain-containing protein [unclassified Bradyrhizobium]|uniref:PIN domain-containing protein n=1 Tax=unclassified Bradyrhizobium TaxID=2631580 RepID=UPI0028E63F01|nr:MULTISPECIES: PIN domain-containing protein [unclassified Bradyrhizobium]